MSVVVRTVAPALVGIGRGRPQPHVRAPRRGNGGTLWRRKRWWGAPACRLGSGCADGGQAEQDAGGTGDVAGGPGVAGAGAAVADDGAVAVEVVRRRVGDLGVDDVARP